MTEILLVLLGIFIFIQLYYYLFIFARLVRYRQDPPNYPQPPEGVSVLVCAWNEEEHLKELLPLLNAQEYPEFEVLVLDDRSWDGTKLFLEENVTQWNHVRFIRIEQEYAHITPKKYALSVGMKHARYPVALMTDADCRPVDTEWIASMVGQLKWPKDIVLGFSPYFRQKGLLNWFIRCETFYTAVQYFSMACAGKPYMGVGRNLMYRTSLFFAHKGFYKHKHIVGGDDDLFMNQAARRSNTAINLNPESFVYSFPKSTWGEWYKQKIRHLSVGRYYRFSHKVRLGLLTSSHIGTWLTGIVGSIWGVLDSNPLLLQVVWGALAVRWLVQTFVLMGINKRLDRTVEPYTFIGMDAALFVYYTFMSIRVLFQRKKKINWR